MIETFAANYGECFDHHTGPPAALPYIGLWRPCVQCAWGAGLVVAPGQAAKLRAQL